MQRWNTFVVGSALIGALSAAHAQNLIENGSFEKPVVTVGGVQTFDLAQHIGKWIVVGEVGTVSIINEQNVTRGFSFPAKSGQQWIDLTGGGGSGTPTGVQQSVPTAEGQAYTLRFSIGNTYDTSGVFGTSSTIHVLIDGVTAMTATNFENGGSSIAWKTFTYTFTASSDHTVVGFINGDVSTDNINGLDAVSLVISGAAAPVEP